MSRRARIILISVIVLSLGIEGAVWLSHNSRSSVEITNSGGTMIEDLVVSFGGSKVAVGKVAPGESAHVWLSGKAVGTLTLAFTQAGNPMSGFLIQEFDPRSMHRDGLKLVIQIKPNEVVKFMDDEVTSTPLGRLRDRIGDWISAECSPFQ